MVLENCKAAISAAIGRDLTEREKGIVARQAEALKQRIALSGADPAAFQKTLADFGDEVKARALLAQRNTALNWRAYSALKAWRQVAHAEVKNPAEVVKALFRGSLFNFQGSKESLANLVAHESNARLGALMADLENAKLTDYAFSGADDKNIISAQHDIRNGITPAPAKYGKNAVDVANMLEKHQEDLRVNQNAAGAWITKNGDRLFRRTHDANKIARAGGAKFGSDAAKANWTKFVGDRMDWDKAFDGDFSNAPAAERQKRLESLHTQFAADTHVQWDNNGAIGNMGTRNFGKKLSHNRELVFKTPQADLEYQQTFGKGNSVTENIAHNLAAGGRDLAMMRKLGPNPLETINQWASDFRKTLAANNDSKGLAAFDKAHADEMKNTWRLLTESTGHPNSNFIGRFMSTVRHTTNTAALGMSIFSVPGDLALRASMIHQAGGGSFAKELIGATTKQFAGIGLSKEATRALAVEGGIRIEGAHMPLDPNLVDHVGFGQVAKYNQMIMRMTGHAPWTNRIRTNSLAADANRHWSMRDTEHANLPQGMRDLMAQFGIDKSGWDVLRKTQGEDLGNGQKAFLPSNVRETDPAAFKPLVGKTATDVQLKRSRDQLTDNYRNMLGELADRSTSSPSIANRAFMKMGLADSGTWQGELLRGALQLKGFAFNYMRNHLGREMLGYSHEFKTLPQAMADMLRGQNNKGAMGLAKLVSAGVGIGFMTNALRDIASGKSPEDPLTLHAAARAFARQSFGLYSDFIMRDSKPDESLYEKVGNELGPEIGLASDLYELMVNKVATHITSKTGYTQKQLDSDSQFAFGTAYRNTPGTNLFWNKWAMDYFVLNNISEQLNPGYQSRLMQRAKKTNQTYLAGSPGFK